MALKVDLSKLPTHIRKLNRYWYYNGKTNKKIPAAKIADYIPKQAGEIK